MANEQLIQIQQEIADGSDRVQGWWPEPDKVIGSKTWVETNEKIDGNPIFDLQIVNAIPFGVELRLLVNKRTHTLVVPKEEETDEQCVVIVKPLTLTEGTD